MNIMFFLPFLLIVVYVAVIFGILYLIYRWVNRFISLRQEQNDLLREIINKMDSK